MDVKHKTSSYLVVPESHEDLSEKKERAAGEFIEVTSVSNGQRLSELSLGIMETTGSEGEEAADIAECTLETLAPGTNYITYSTDHTH